MEILLYNLDGTLNGQFIDCQILFPAPVAYCIQDSRPPALHFQGLRQEGSRTRVEREIISTTLPFVITYRIANG